MTGADPNVFPTLDNLHPEDEDNDHPPCNIPIFKKVVHWGIREAVYLLLDAGANPHQALSDQPAETPIPDLSWRDEEERLKCTEIIDKAQVTPLSLKNRSRNVILKRLHECSGARFVEFGYLKGGSGVDRIGNLPGNLKRFLKYEDWSCPN